MNIADLKSRVLPALFLNPSELGQYGRTSGSAKSMAELGDLLENSPLSRLASSIAAIVGGLTDADPKKLAKKPTWLERVTGQSVETHVRYHAARKHLDTLLEEARAAAQAVHDAVGAIDRLMSTHETEASDLQAYIQAGQEYLAENPDAGKAATGEIEFGNARERFARKLANLSTLLASHQLSVTQMKLTKGNALDMLDRFEETERVLVPVWRQHSLTLATSKNMNAAMVAEATKAHEALVKSLALSANALDH